ncbi:hypothetical protein ACGFW5_00075 [Streptomyces sp. NPDC048416]|uniref:hypothetical protein n=1 Tax=Streptomyces sp. NPDC048416 TaxID=3365546 RepID=UPI0037196E22
MVDVKPFPVSLFSDGPALRILDIAIAVQESGGELSLDLEIQRYIRLVRNDVTADWNCSVYAAAGVLTFVADSVESHGGLSDFPPEFREKTKRACGDMEPVEYVRTLAEIVLILNRQPTLEYSELPVAGWEFLRMFRYFFGLHAILMDDGDREFDEIVADVVSAEHPYCHDIALAYTIEAQRAMVLYPGEGGLSAHLSWATRDALLELIDTVNDHMRREHS